jgi:hypothetical protein
MYFYTKFSNLPWYFYQIDTSFFKKKRLLGTLLPHYATVLLCATRTTIPYIFQENTFFLSEEDYESFDFLFYKTSIFANFSNYFDLSTIAVDAAKEQPVKAQCEFTITTEGGSDFL